MIIMTWSRILCELRAPGLKKAPAPAWRAGGAGSAAAARSCCAVAMEPSGVLICRPIFSITSSFLFTLYEGR